MLTLAIVTWLFVTPVLADDHAALAMKMSIEVSRAGAALSKFENAYKLLDSKVKGHAEAAASYLWLNFLATTLLLESSIVGAPSKMPKDQGAAYVSLVANQLRAANKTCFSTITMLHKNKDILPNETLKLATDEALNAVDTGLSYTGNFFALHNALERGDPINADIDNAKGK